jgi:DNA-binding response OmpR family regulator
MDGQMESAASAGTIVIVDDTPELLDLLDALLTDEGYRVIPCQHATQAHELIAREQPDLVMLDLRMAGVAAWEVLDRLKADDATANIPVIVCSGAVDELQAAEPRLRALRCDILVKPFDIDDLVARVRRAVRRA